MPITPKDVLTDPKFMALTPDQRRQVLLRIDPKFASLSTDQQQAVLNFRPPNVSTLPPGEISTGPHGIAKAKSSGYRALLDWGLPNLDAIGGTAGGLLGAGAGPPGAIGGAALGGSAGEALRQLINTYRGKPQESSSDAAMGIGLSGLEQGGMEGLGYLGSWLGKLIKPGDRLSKLAFGTRAGELSPELKLALPDIDKTASRVGKPKSLEEFASLLKQTERGLNTEFSLALQPIAAQQTVPVQIASAIRNQITPNMAKTPEGRAAMRYLQNRALQFENQPWTIQELNAERELITKRLRAYHNAVRSGQAAQAKVESSIAADTAAESALKDMLYSAADRSGGKPPGYFQGLKHRQSGLISLMDAVENSQSRIAKETTEKAGAPLSQKVRLHGYLHPQSGIPGTTAGVNPGMFSNAQRISDTAIAGGFPSATQSGVNALRSVAGTAISQPDVNALPLRLVFSNFMSSEGSNEQAQER